MLTFFPLNMILWCTKHISFHCEYKNETWNLLYFLLILNLPPTNSWFFVKIFRGIGDNWTKPNFTEDSKGCLVRVVFNQVEKNNPKVIFDESSLQRGWGKNIFCEWFCSSSKVLHWLQIWLRNFAALYTLLPITIHWCMIQRWNIH